MDTAKAAIAVTELGELGVVAAKIVLPDPDVKRIRESYGHSQAEFATHFGLQLDAIRNWEQGRNHPDPSARLLLRVIEKCPEAVEYALTDYSTSLDIKMNEPRRGG
jgi:putative transcriptional regulator